MTKESDFANDLLDFIHASPSPFHVVKNIEDILTAKGFSEPGLAEKWSLSKGGKYFITKNDSAIIAFAVGNGSVAEEGFRIVGSHTDSPSFRIKPSPEMVVEKTYLKLNTEVYGGPILNTWLDRPLSMAGRVSLKTDDPLHPETRLISMGRPVLIIPNQSLHMNRKVNEGIELNKQKDMLPLVACVNEEFEKDGFLVKVLAQELGVDADRIVDFDLFLHEYEKGSIVGLNSEFISSTKLDDLAMVHAGLHALINTEAAKATNVLVCYDNEEVGNRTKQGAASPILRTLLERIVLALGKDREDFFRAIYHSFLISADMGHGIHPNAADKHDPVNKPAINGGPMIKVSAAQNFTTDSNSATVYEAICQQAGIPVQRFVSRSDLKGGSTIGPVSSTHLDMRSLDVGNPALAMHSIRELCGVLDHDYMRRSFEAFY
ncbi:MAG: M18 family aminopeptidase, partial [Chloroflexi bacterium]|nr:M18 family aminopeptidase [Chloroflexota bacterium]